LTGPGYWRPVWEAKAAEPEFSASGRSSGDPGQLFALLSDACSALQLNVADRLLDLGCGVGLLARHMAPYVSAVVGLDFAVSLLARTRDLVPSARLAAGDVLRLPFREGAFSKVLASSVLQYLDSLDAVGVSLAEMRRVTAKGGRAFASGNPDLRKKKEYIEGIDRLDLPEERKEQLRERNRAAFWISPEALRDRAQEAGWQAEIRPIAAAVWQSFYMFDLLLTAG
jgi:SAM-dependent methyltransferase